ncbi:MAG: hypothetical protein BroJett013_11970 [Alphaproteobacteria bacterium]|nr:MAG: hypothetical protein BroJett013_11970 [Alphaproteobacteria bacterium]
MAAGDYQPGDYVAHPKIGACRVVGVGDVTAAGQTFEALTLAPLAHPRATVSVPVSKLDGARLRVVSREEAERVKTEAEQARDAYIVRMSWFGKRGGARFAQKMRLAK